MKTKEELLELIPQLHQLEDSDTIEVWDFDDPDHPDLWKFFTEFVKVGGFAIVNRGKAYVPIKYREKA